MKKAHSSLARYFKNTRASWLPIMFHIYIILSVSLTKPCTYLITRATRIPVPELFFPRTMRMTYSYMTNFFFLISNALAYLRYLSERNGQASCSTRVSTNYFARARILWSWKSYAQYIVLRKKFERTVYLVQYFITEIVYVDQINNYRQLYTL